MTLCISVPEDLSQPSQAERSRSIRQPWTIPLVDTSGKSQGYRQSVNLRPGLSILIDDYTLQDDLTVFLGEEEPCVPYQYLEMSFMLSGHNHQERVQPYHSFIVAAWRDSFGSQFQWQADQHALKFDIHIDLVLFATLVGEQFDALPPLFRQIIQGSHPSQEWFVDLQPMTAAMQSAIHRILHCPYRGLIRWLYLESQVLELIALRLEQIIEGPQEPALLSWTGVRHARLYQARDILLSRLDNPPSVLELAREVGLNHNKLKQGFRQVFGTTVFGYSQLCRLEKARQLLYEGHLNVAAVANEVGYANAAKFASAFKRKFGITPSACRSSTKPESLR